MEKKTETTYLGLRLKVLGFYGKNGKENGSCCSGLRVKGLGLYTGYVGIVGLYLAYIGVIEGFCRVYRDISKRLENPREREVQN